MPSLRELQVEFLSGLFEGNGAIDAQIVSSRLPAARWLAIYRNNVRHTLTGALRDVYPVVEKLVGPEFFAQMARDFLLKHPSTSGNLHEFGATLDKFICSYVPTANLVYLADLARLEWLYHRAFHAADAKPFDLAVLQSMPAEDVETLRFSLQPAAGLLESHFPVLRIWQVNQPEYGEAELINLNDGGVRLLVWRDGYTLHLTALPHGEFVFVTWLMQGAGLADACEAALEADPAFAAQSCLQRLVAQNILTGCLPHTEGK